MTPEFSKTFLANRHPKMPAGKMPGDKYSLFMSNIRCYVGESRDLGMLRRNDSAICGNAINYPG